MARLETPRAWQQRSGNAENLQGSRKSYQALMLFNPIWFPSVYWFRQYLKQRGTAISPLVGKGAPFQANRTIIRGPNGLQQLSIPLQKSSREDLRLIRPLNSHKWARECCNALKTAYGNSAFFRYYDYLIEPLFFKEYEHLLQMNMEALQLMCSCFNFPIPELDDSGPGINPDTRGFADLTDYGQYFTERYPFSPEVGVLDVLFHCGPLGGLVLAGKAL
jgi:hypothetical protein